jgi:hypothetical protein
MTAGRTAAVGIYPAALQTYLRGIDAHLFGGQNFVDSDIHQLHEWRLK